MNSSANSNAPITINGILVPVAWNSAGQVVCTAVSTFDEKEYRIADQETSDQWQVYLNRQVSVRGRPYLRGIEQWITVQSFHVIDSEPLMQFDR